MLSCVFHNVGKKEEEEEGKKQKTNNFFVFLVDNVFYSFKIYYV